MSKTTLGQIVEIARDRIRPFPDQPRKYFDKTALAELAASIREVGQQVPITVRALDDDPHHDHELVDGQRRWIVCGMIQRAKMLAWVRVVEDEDEQLVASVVSNFGRCSHTILEIASALQRLGKMGKSPQQIADICARSVPWVYQHLSILRLHEDVRAMMEPTVPDENRLTFSTALLLVSLPDVLQVEVATKITKEGMSLKRAHHFVRKAASAIGLKAGDPTRSPKEDYRNLMRLLWKFREGVELTLDMPTSAFQAMFARRTTQEKATLLTDIRECIDDLGIMAEAIEKSTEQ